MSFQKTLLTSSILSCALFASASSAHSRYIMPSHTSLSGEQPSAVSFDLSITEDLFHPDIAFGGEQVFELIPAIKVELTEEQAARNARRMARFADTKLRVTAPDGSVHSDAKIVNVGRKSVSGFSLSQSGTYRVAVASQPLMFTTFVRDNGKRGRVFGDKSDQAIPEGATELKTTQMLSTIETYVTRNATSTQALSPTNKGIELNPKNSTHPNDAFSGDTASIQFLLNGEPVSKDTEVSLVRAGSIYRNNRNETTINFDDKGKLNFTWPEAGMYHLAFSITEQHQGTDIDEIRYGYSASFEVFP